MSVKNVTDGETCVYCLRFQPYELLDYEFTPDTHFTAESMDWKCKDDADCRKAAEAYDAEMAAQEAWNERHAAMEMYLAWLATDEESDVSPQHRRTGDPR